jgi:hypothetical protein
LSDYFFEHVYTNAGGRFNGVKLISTLEKVLSIIPFAPNEY